MGPGYLSSLDDMFFKSFPWFHHYSWSVTFMLFNWLTADKSEIRINWVFCLKSNSWIFREELRGEVHWFLHTMMAIVLVRFLIYLILIYGEKQV